MTDGALEARLADPASRNDAFGEVARLLGDGISPDVSVREQIARIIREPDTVASTRDFTSLLADINDAIFVIPLVEIIGADRECDARYTLNYMYALGMILEECDEAIELTNDVFSEAFIAQLGRWLLHTGGGELSWKAGNILHNIRVPQSYEFMRQGASDGSLFFQTRYYCLKGLVNGRGAAELPLLLSLANDPEPNIRENVAHAIKRLSDTASGQGQALSPGNRG